MNPGSVRDTATYGIIDDNGASVHDFSGRQQSES